jgi:trans-aconitate 2-methyltransferase
VSRIPDLPVKLAADLGCGTGKLTASLLRRWPDAHIVGVDNSREMLARAAAHARPGKLEFAEGDLRTWQAPHPLDLIVSNAALHWIVDHAALLARLSGLLAPGGCLAVQMPNNREEPAYRFAVELADEPPWRERLRDAPFSPEIQSAPWYVERLAENELEADVWETIYYQPLADADAIVEWMKGTLLRPVLAALSEADAARYLQQLGARVRTVYPTRSFGVLFPFKRLFFVARRRRSADR